MSARKMKAKRRGKKRAGKKTMSFDKRVAAVMSRQLEDKCTQTNYVYNHVLDHTNAGLYQWSRFFPSAPTDAQGIWNIGQGVGNAQRVGNKIKVKSWVIKGLIQPLPYTEASTVIGNSQIGYVTVYLGRLQSGGGAVAEGLDGLFQQGNTSITPTGLSLESLYAINTDRYKVYAKKTFKMGQQFSTTPNVPGNVHGENNDFSLTAKFTFDVTKYVFKNRHIMYDDTNTVPQNFDMSTLCCWATFQPATGNISLAGGSLERSFYTIQMVSYGHYEDA